MATISQKDFIDQLSKALLAIDKKLMEHGPIKTIISAADLMDHGTGTNGTGTNGTGTNGGQLYTQSFNKNNAICKLCKTLISNEDVAMFSSAMGLDLALHYPQIPDFCTSCAATEGQEQVVGSGLKAPVKTLYHVSIPVKAPHAKYHKSIYNGSFPFNGQQYNDALEKYFKESCPSLVAMWAEKMGWGYDTAYKLCFTFDSSSPKQVELELKTIVNYLKALFFQAEWGDINETLQSINL
jgi:hypothetical protein